MNITVISGTLTRPAAERVLPSGDRMVNLEVQTVTPDAQGLDTVPVIWADAPASALSYDTGQIVTVVGRVRRRFFRTVSGTGSRTEVNAITVVPADKGKRYDAALSKVIEQLAVAL